MPSYISLQAAAQQLSNSSRVSVIGCSGGGKSTLSNRISEHFNLPYLSYDRDVRWLPGWVARERNERFDILRTLSARERWVFDGTSPKTFHIRLPRTELIIWVRVPRRVALVGVMRRVLRHHGTTRPGMAEGCIEKFPDREFLSYIWNFEKHSAPVVIKNIDQHAPHVPVVVLYSRQDFDLLFAEA